MIFYFFIALVSISQLSVLNKLTGNPSLLNKLGVSVLLNAKRTATGLFIFLLETITLLPAIFACAATNTLS